MSIGLRRHRQAHLRARAYKAACDRFFPQLGQHRPPSHRVWQRQDRQRPSTVDRRARLGSHHQGAYRGYLNHPMGHAASTNVCAYYSASTKTDGPTRPGLTSPASNSSSQTSTSASPSAPSPSLPPTQPNTPAPGPTPLPPPPPPYQNPTSSPATAPSSRTSAPRNRSPTSRAPRSQISTHTVRKEM